MTQTTDVDVFEQIQDTPPQEIPKDPYKQEGNMFENSRKLKQEFLIWLLEDLKELNKLSKNKKEPWEVKEPLGLPFNSETGHNFSGANQAKLILASMKNGYTDNRFVTFKQIQKLKKDFPELGDLKIKEGEHGTKLMRPQKVTFHINEEDKKWTKLKEGTAPPKEEGVVKSFIVFHPYVVFNASQVEGFPPKQVETQKFDQSELSKMVGRFAEAADVGVKVEQDTGITRYEPTTDTVSIPSNPKYEGKNEVIGSYLQEVYRATGQPNRENRMGKNAGQKEKAIENMSSQIFSMLAAGAYGFTVPKGDNSIPDAIELAGKDKDSLLKAIGKSSHMITAFEKINNGEEPSQKWFTKLEEDTQFNPLEEVFEKNPDIPEKAEEKKTSSRPRM